MHVITNVRVVKSRDSVTPLFDSRLAIDDKHGSYVHLVRSQAKMTINLELKKPGHPCFDKEFT